ncbi:hypothetical protein [Bernardetia sp.]|uniref:hypothetical protein n=1 Tax=Bernardetia sp. TaxID=1937974 RepID=UPI0025C5A4EA|nr:hypothetical protein [Bernardetia sp.]
MNATKVYTLQSGVEVESEFITGNHLEIFSKQGTKNNKTKMLLALVKRIGDNKNIKLSDIEKMPINDVTDLMIQLRLDCYDPEIAFVLEWENQEKNKFKHEHKIELTEDFFEKQAPEKLITSYDDLEYEYDVQLPVSKAKVRLKVLTQGDLDKLGGTINLQDVHLNTLLEWRKPRIITIDTNTDGKEVERPNKCDLKKLIARDLSFLQKQVNLKEGKINTSYEFTHPIKELAFLPKQTVDIVNSLGFLFPSLT